MAKNRTSAIMKAHTDRLKSEGKITAKWFESGNYLELEMNLEIIKYHRHRHSSNVTYDPMGVYKKTLKEMIQEALDASGIELSKEMLAKPLRLETAYATVPAKSAGSIGKIALMAKGLLARSKTPDIDNFSKTTYDVLNGLTWKDDSQIIESNARKVYHTSEATLIRIHYLDEYDGSMDYKDLIKDGWLTPEDVEFARNLKKVNTTSAE